MERAKHPIRRCAVYTRKSTEEGLEQDFNSLHAQREACEAFIISQQGEGWRLIRTAYDDGGISGGTMERPALQRLLEDIGHGLIDVVVVYKAEPGGPAPQPARWKRTLLARPFPPSDALTLRQRPREDSRVGSPARVD